MSTESINYLLILLHWTLFSLWSRIFCCLCIEDMYCIRRICNLCVVGSLCCITLRMMTMLGFSIWILENSIGFLSPHTRLMLAWVFSTDSSELKIYYWYLKTLSFEKIITYVAGSVLLRILALKKHLSSGFILIMFKSLLFIFVQNLHIIISTFHIIRSKITQSHHKFDKILK